MKKYLLSICLLLATTTLLNAQTGTGIVAQINSPYTITPTTVDSTTTITIQFNNTLPTTNIAIFTGLNSPFSTDVNSIAIAANDSVTIDITKFKKIIKKGIYMELINYQYDIEKLAIDCGTISNEILTSISSRVKRVYI